MPNRKFILPCEPDYTGHREEQKRRQETKEWLRERERAIKSPATVPDHEREPEAA